MKKTIHDNIMEFYNSTSPPYLILIATTVIVVIMIIFGIAEIRNQNKMYKDTLPILVESIDEADYLVRNRRNIELIQSKVCDDQSL